MPFSIPVIKVKNSSDYNLIVHIEGIRGDPFSFIQFANISLWKSEIRDIMVHQQKLFKEKDLEIPCNQHRLFEVFIYKTWYGIPILIHHNTLLPKEILNVQNHHIEHSIINLFPFGWICILFFVVWIMMNLFRF